MASTIFNHLRLIIICIDIVAAWNTRMILVMTVMIIWTFLWVIILLVLFI